MRYLVLLCLTIGLTAPVAADPPKFPKELAIVPKDGLMVLSVNVAAAWDRPALKPLRDGLADTPLAAEMAAHTGLTLDQLERLTLVAVTSGRDDGSFPFELLMVLTARKPIEKAAVVKAAHLYGIDEAKDLKAKGRKPGEKLPPPSGKADAAYYVGEPSRTAAFADDRTLVITNALRLRTTDWPPNPLDAMASTAEAGALDAGLALAVEHPVALGLNTTGLKLTVGRDRNLPDEVLPLLRADHVAAFARLGTEAADLTVTAVFAGMQWADDGEASAKKARDMAVFVLKEQTKRLINREGSDSVPAAFLQTLSGTLEKGAVKRAGNAVTLTARYDLGAKTQALLAAVPGATTESANQIRSQNNLKQLGLAYHGYHDVTNAGPGNVVGKDGKPLLSWRVHLLPYVEQAQLYAQFKLDEPWDSDANKKLIEKMPSVYALPGVKTKEAGLTFYQGFVGKKDGFSRALFTEGEKQGVRFTTITDGMSNTLLCVEAAEPVIWTKPDDLPFDPQGQLPKLGGHMKRGFFQALLCDGSVRNFRTDLPEAMLKAYITIQGGEVIADDK